MKAAQSIFPCSEKGCGLQHTREVLVHSPPDGSEDEDTLQLRICQNCSMGFVHPRPTPAVLARYYTPDYPYYANPNATRLSLRQSLKFRLASWRYRRLLGQHPFWILPELVAKLSELALRRSISFSLGVPLILPRNARFLDYGFGSGEWLFGMQQLGYEQLAGYDIAANTARPAELRAAGIRVLTPDDIKHAPPGSFDCVRLEHVLEHIPEPSPLLLRLRELLLPGGYLVMTLPSIYPWLDADDLRQSPHTDHLQIPIHVVHHSRQSLSRTLRDAQFRVVGLRVTRRERFLTVLAIPGAE
jgi:SAM-dependent methyltransferase